MQDGDLQLFGLEEGGILDAMPLEDDHVTAVAALEAEPYVLLGCASGAVRIVALLKAGGGTAEGVARISSMEMLPYAGNEATQGSCIQRECLGVVSSLPPALLPNAATECDLLSRSFSHVGVVSPEQLHGKGAVVSLAAHEGGSKPHEAVLLLVVHEQSGAAVWDARYRTV